MVPRIYPAGKSFAGLAAYLAHDAGKAKTSERVAWTHTLNLANDDIPSAVHEMLWTCRAADQLKRRAGIGTGGSKLENPVKHYSLNWHPTDTPTREEMIEAVQGFMARLGIQDRQAVLFSHSDKPYAHVHLMVNSVSPTDGRSISTSFEKARASSWALAYEREHFGIHCEQRLKPAEEREPSPTRATWERLKEYERQDNQVEEERASKDFDYFERGDGDTAVSREWRALKAHQRTEREQFFAGGKEAYREVRNAAYREVREEFRPQWQNFYQMKRDGMEPELLATLKTEIIADQKLELDIRRAEMSGKLRKERDEEYHELLRHHREERADLTQRQSEELRSYALLDSAYPVRPEAERAEEPSMPDPAGERIMEGFQRAGEEICAPSPAEAAKEEREEPMPEQDAANEHFKVRDGVDALGGLGLGLLGAIATIGEKLFDGFLGGGETPPPRPAPRQKEPANENIAARRTATTQAADEARAAEEAALLAWWDERRSRRRERD